MEKVGIILTITGGIVLSITAYNNYWRYYIDDKIPLENYVVEKQEWFYRDKSFIYYRSSAYKV